jgi:predicted glycogen debranching enzyme
MTNVTRVGWERGRDTAETSINREWLVANGLGGYASGTLAGVSTRRYHGLLVSALPNPWGRTMMLDHLIEQVALPDGTQYRLSAENWSTTESSAKSDVLDQFRLELGLPVWTYLLGGILLERRLILAHLQNTVYLRYRLLSNAPGEAVDNSVTLGLRPAMHFRPHDAPVSRPMDPYTLSLIGDRFEVSTNGPLPSLKMRVEGDSPTFHFYPERQEQINYRWEAARGYEAHGTLWSPGLFQVKLSAQQPAYLVASSELWETMNAVEPTLAWQYERERRFRLIHAVPSGRKDATAAELILATDQFVIVPAGRVSDSTRAKARGEDLRSVIAGYHWFTDWGRDTMISLEGLTLCSGRFTEARYILHSFAHYVRNGLIPNLFPEGSQEGLYHTADATLWFFHAIDRYLAYTGDTESLQLLLPTLLSIAKAHLDGTVFGIAVDPSDGLLTQGQEGFALTWMDALCDGWVVTPRQGKAVEINALWFNALVLLGTWLESEGEHDGAKLYKDAAQKAKESFNRRFWSDSVGYLADVLDKETGAPDFSLRPNQIFAISLPHPILEPSRWQAVVDRVGEALLTPFGLRSLDPHHADFKPNYHGDLRTRDAAYHQGTVWSWLIGPFVEAWLKVHPNERERARSFLLPLRDHLGQACIGQVAEIFDATAPFLPRGCVAQAWGIAELLRAWNLTDAPT